MGHYKIPLNPPFPKGEMLVSSLWQREVGRDFTRKFQTTKLIAHYKFQCPIFNGQFEFV